MLDSLKRKITILHHTSGIEASIDPSGEVWFSGISLSLVKGKLARTAIVYRVKDPAELQGCKGAVSLVCSGRGIVTKLLPGIHPPPNPLSVVFPQANSADFYVQVVPIKEATLITVARKATIDPIIALLAAVGNRPLQIHLGVSAISGMLHLVPDQTLELPGIHLQIGHGEILHCSFHTEELGGEQEEYLVAGLYIRKWQLPAFAAAVSLLANDLRDPLPEFHPAIIANRRSYIQQRYFRTAGFCTVLFLFLLLLINFFLFDYLSRENGRFAREQGVSLQNEQQENAILKRVEGMETFLQAKGWQRRSRTSFLADRFASLLPPDTWFSHLYFYPPAATFYADNIGALRFRKDTIQLEAFCRDAGQINVFINNLRTLADVTAVNLKSYSFKREEGYGEFSLQIVTR